MKRRRMHRRSIHRRAVIISINEEEYDRNWMDGLLNGESQTYATKKIIDAYRNMPVFLYYKDAGIRWHGVILDPNDGYPVIGNVIEMRRLIDIDEMRRINIIKRNPPRQTQYLNPRQFQILHELT